MAEVALLALAVLVVSIGIALVIRRRDREQEEAQKKRDAMEARLTTFVRAYESVPARPITRTTLRHRIPEIRRNASPVNNHTVVTEYPAVSIYSNPDLDSWSSPSGGCDGGSSGGDAGGSFGGCD